jgi:hypothetical protein
MKLTYDASSGNNDRESTIFVSQMLINPAVSRFIITFVTGSSIFIVIYIKSKLYKKRLRQQQIKIF